MIRPIKIRGDSYYVMFVHPYHTYDIRRAATGAGSWYDIQRMQLANSAVKDNPIFTGALGVYNNVILHESFRVTSGFNSATGAVIPTVKRAVFCGAQSAAMAFGRDNTPERATWVEELFDYGNQLGVSAGFIFGLKRLVFNNQSFSSIVVPTYAVQH
jgi:N4-gp56 family major capsid protein